MTIDSRFSKDQFRMAFESNPSSRHVSDQLQAEALQLLQEVVAPKVNEIVTRLNQLGHQLNEYYPPQPGDIGFRDDRERDGRYECDLRLGVDIVVSVGYHDTRDVPDDY
ncbi:hypothetical protein [Paludibaculum fermentans]|uniref:hypothetical protein n=1 Tax=Paludibaculum fermentans TaxID=1473598 RepID=UPI003EBDEEC0